MKNFMAASSPLLEGRSPTPIVGVSLPHHHDTGQPPAGSGSAAAGVHVRLAQRPVQVARIVQDPADQHALRLDAVDDQVAAVRSEEHTSELQSLMRSSYAVF